MPSFLHSNGVLPCCAVRRRSSWVRARFVVESERVIADLLRGRQAAGQRAGVRFLKHNIRDEFDDVTDIAAFYRVKSVPSFLFLVGGAQARTLPRLKRLFWRWLAAPGRAYGRGEHLVGSCACLGAGRRRPGVRVAGPRTGWAQVPDLALVGRPGVRTNWAQAPVFTLSSRLGRQNYSLLPRPPG